MVTKEQLDLLPNNPGVYLMKDASDTVIYVGKAKNLRKRVRQYFGSYGQSSSKVRAMVSHIEDYEYIIVENEIESLVLEQNLIKEKRPKYNVLLRDDKQYPYIKITRGEEFPRVLKTRRLGKDGSKYYGPFPNTTAVNEAIDRIHEFYPIRDCHLNIEKSIGKVRPCLNYFIHRCMGPCTGEVSSQDYKQHIEDIQNFLDGKKTDLYEKVREAMKKASENLEFEQAAKYRDSLRSLEILSEKQKITEANSDKEQDVIAIARDVNDVLVQIFFIRNGKIIGREHFLLDHFNQESTEEITETFIKQFYSGTAHIPKEILVEKDLSDSTIEDWLSQKRKSRVHIQSPKIGEKRDLVRLAKQNAIDMLSKNSDKYKRKKNERKMALEDLQDILDLKDFPHRLECYDISNISGVESVGSMVVYEDGLAKKSDYRKFKIKTVQGPDDYKSMEEVLTRRFLRGQADKKDGKINSFYIYPDVLLIDGGLGQVNVVTRALDKLGIQIPIVGLVKDDFHKTRGLVYQGKEIRLKVASRLYRLLFSIQEEAHRFALNYHKSLHTKSMFKSQLDDIPGIGPKRKQALMKHFKSIQKIKEASIEELKEVDGMNSKAAESLKNYWKENS